MEHVIEARDLSFGYDDDPIIDGIDLAVDRGECILVCGPSGCGKTTLAKCLCGIVPNLNRQGEMQGTAELDGEPTDILSKTDLADTAAAFVERANDRIEIETATDADAARSFLADNDVDCIVSDYDMPSENGIEFLECIRETHPDLPPPLHREGVGGGRQRRDLRRRHGLCAEGS